jgi:NAD(P)-dependent dehydrogenase (short-subunit alcohol dehydrogenase family)
MNKAWLVTGSASGLGRSIAEAVLESGDRLVVTTARPGHGRPHFRKTTFALMARRIKAKLNFHCKLSKPQPGQTKYNLKRRFMQIALFETETLQFAV